MGCKVNQTKKNYYLSFLPKYNPSAVFIFNYDGDIVFKSDSAKQKLNKIKNINDLGVKNAMDIINKNKKITLVHETHNKQYQIDFISVPEEKLLLSYFTDITEIFKLNVEIEETQREIIYAMGEIGETRSKETGNHVKRVAHYSYELAKLYGLDDEESSKLKMASPMHDIGKVGIPDAILNAPRKLTADEFQIMKTHSILGYNMLKNSTKPILQAAAIVAREHHEKYDGGGYPDGKEAEDIHIYGRITAVADVFDALGSDRVYKKAWKLDKILDFFDEQNGKHFDPKLIKLLKENLDIFLQIREKFKDVY